MARRFGLGQPTGLDLPGEKPGLIPDTAWKRATFDDAWYPGESLIAGIGQGFIQVTPLQLAGMAFRIANGGLATRPSLLAAAGAHTSSRTITTLTPLTNNLVA